MDSKINWNIFSKNRNAIYGIAIISIMIFHFFEDVVSSDLSGGLQFVGKIYNTFIGSVGVEFFVFLSGMGLYFSMEKDSDILHFFHKRVQRIFPAYFIVAGIYWILVDIIVESKGLIVFVTDISFATFFMYGTRTFWYVLFILLAYLIYPFVYETLCKKQDDYSKLIILVVIAVLIQLFPKIITPAIYPNIEILLGRFLVFFIGCWCGKKVYQNELINNKEKLGLFGGAVLMICKFLPMLKSVIEKLGYRFLMCFWGIFLLYSLAINLKKLPRKAIELLEKIGKISYELYLTHVAIRALMNTIGIKTYYFQNYALCILLSFLLTFMIVKLQRRMFHEK